MTFRNRFFLRLAISEAGALIAFVVSLLIGPWWIYVVGLAFTAVGFARIAPTRRMMVREQDVLTLDGCDRSLMRAVRTC